MYQFHPSPMVSSAIAALLMLATSSLVSASATELRTASDHDQQRDVHVSTVHQFPNGTWLENLTQRPDGSILVTELYHPNLWQINPSKPATQSPVLVTEVSGKMGLYGIVEIDVTLDVYTFSAGNLSMDNNGSPFVRGSFSIYSVDLARSKNLHNFPVTPTKLADFPDAGVLNGITFLPPTSKYPKGGLLSADGITGAIWVLNLETLKPAIWFRDAFLVTCPPGIQGVNGVKYSAVDKRLYFTNTGCGFVASIEVDRQTGQPIGRPLIAGGRSQGLSPDDFDVNVNRKSGTAFVSDLSRNQIFAVDLASGVASSIAGSANSTEIAHPTAVKVGRTVQDKKEGVVYVTTTGGLPNGINGRIVGGQVLAIKDAIRHS